MTVLELIERLKREVEDGRGHWTVIWRVQYEAKGEKIVGSTKYGRDRSGPFVELLPK